MKVAIHQPNYIPWLGYFYKMYLSDIFVHLDDAQYSNEGGHNFNYIKTSQGVFRLKFPVEQHMGDLINQVRPKNELKWREKHLRTIAINYAKAKFFKKSFPELKEVYMVDYPNVAELNIAINVFLAEKFGIKVQYLRSSQFTLQTNREKKVLDLCVQVGGTRYISGNGARVYQEENHFSDIGIELSYIDYQPIEYPQIWGKFLPCMSTLDYIFNCGYDWNYVVKEVARLNERNR